MFRRFYRPTLVNLRAVLSVLTVVAITLVAPASAYLHIVLPAGSNWG